MTRAAEHRLVVLWLLVLPFAIWGAHFLAAYVVTAIQCAKSSDAEAAILTVRWAVTAITLLSLAALGATVWYGRRQRRRENAQARFVWSMLLMMSALSALAMLYVGAVVFFFGDCR